MALSWQERPIFFVVGAPRCGTTAFTAALRAHPGICFSAPKEPHYFSRLPADWSEARLARDFYGVFFRHCADPGAMLGEGSVSYFYSDPALEAIERALPQARYIAMLRNPLEMIPSYHSRLLYLMDEDEPDLARAWALQEVRARRQRIPRRCRDWRMLQYRLVGMLGARCAALRQRIPPERLRLILFDDFVADPIAVYRDTLSFLGLPDDGRTVLARRNRSRIPKSTILHMMLVEPRSEIVREALKRLRHSKRLRPLGRLLERLRKSGSVPAPQGGLPPALRAEMAEAFAADVRLLAGILGRDLDHWLRPPIAEGAAAAAGAPGPALPHPADA